MGKSLPTCNHDTGQWTKRKDGHTYCRSCRRIAARIDRGFPDSTPDRKPQGRFKLKQEERTWKLSPYYQVIANRKSLYGVTQLDFIELCEKQLNKCAICNNNLFQCKRQPHVDHDHVTKIVRGVLCELCNRGLGHFKDSPELLQSAIDYLEKDREMTERNFAVDGQDVSGFINVSPEYMTYAGPEGAPGVSGPSASESEENDTTEENAVLTKDDPTGGAGHFAAFERPVTSNE